MFAMVKDKNSIALYVSKVLLCDEKRKLFDRY